MPDERKPSAAQTKPDAQVMPEVDLPNAEPAPVTAASTDAEAEAVNPEPTQTASDQAVQDLPAQDIPVHDMRGPEQDGAEKAGPAKAGADKASPAAPDAAPDPFSVDAIEAEFARLLNRGAPPRS
jgi:hypothetical protein